MEALERVMHHQRAGQLPHAGGRPTVHWGINSHFQIDDSLHWPKQYAPIVRSVRPADEGDDLNVTRDQSNIYRHDSVAPVGQMPAEADVVADENKMLLIENRRQRLLLEEFGRLDLTKDGVLDSGDVSAWAKRVAWMRHGRHVDGHIVSSIENEIWKLFDRGQNRKINFEDFVARYENDSQLQSNVTDDEAFESFVKASVGKPGRNPRLDEVLKCMAPGTHWKGHLTFLFEKIPLTLDITGGEGKLLHGTICAGNQSADVNVHLHNNGTITIVREGGFMEGFVYVGSRTITGLVDGRVEEPFTLTVGTTASDCKDAGEVSEQRHAAEDEVREGLDKLKAQALKSGLSVEEFVHVVEAHIGYTCMGGVIPLSPKSQMEQTVCKQGEESGCTIQ